MTDSHEQPDDPAIDSAVRDALAVRVDELSVARLERAWRDAKAAHRARRQRNLALTAAAVALLAVGLAAWRATPGGREVAQQQPQPHPPRGKQPIATPAPPVASRAPTAARAPTALEVAAFYSLTPRSSARPVALLTRRDELAETREPSIVEQVDALIAEGSPRAAERFARLKPKNESYGALAARLDDPAAALLLWRLTMVRSESERAASLLSAAKPAAIEGLFSELSGDNPRRRREAAGVLAAINGQEVTQRLIEIITTDPRHAEAWLALASCQHPLARQFLGHASQQPRLLGFLNAAQARWVTASPLQSTYGVAAGYGELGLWPRR